MKNNPTILNTVEANTLNVDLDVGDTWHKEQQVHLQQQVDCV